MRRLISLTLALTTLIAFQPASIVGVLEAQGTGGVSGTSDFTKYAVRARSVTNGTVASSGTTTEAGTFTLGALNPGDYIIEIVGPDGTIVGTSASVVSVAAGQTVAVTVEAIQALIAAAAASAAGVAGAAAAAALGAAAAAAPALAAGLIIGGTTLGVVVGAALAIGLTAAVIANNDDASPNQ